MSNNIQKLNKNLMASTKHVCQVCGKGPVAAYNKPHSMTRTKRVVKPNTQQVQGLTVCTRCMRTALKNLSKGLPTPKTEI
jgi:ribosomal protein L28